MRSTLLTGLVALTLGGCVIGPHDGWVYGSRSDTVSFIGYASESLANVVIECKVVSSGAWLNIGGDTADLNPGNPGQDDLLYQFYDQVQIPNSCWQNNGEFGWLSHVRVREPAAAHVTQLYTFNDSGITCLNGKLANDEEWVPAGGACATGTSLTLYAES